LIGLISISVPVTTPTPLDVGIQAIIANLSRPRDRILEAAC